MINALHWLDSRLMKSTILLTLLQLLLCFICSNDQFGASIIGVPLSLLSGQLAIGGGTASLLKTQKRGKALAVQFVAAAVISLVR